MIILFTEDELRNGSVTGKKSNFIKSGELKKKLDDQKVKAIKGINVYKLYFYK